MIEIVPATKELMENSDIPYELPENQICQAAAFVNGEKVIGVAAFKEVNKKLIIGAYLTDELKKRPMAFHRVAVRTLEHLHKTYNEIYAPGEAVSRDWLLRLGFKPCTDRKDLFGEKEGYIKCHQPR